ncbi:MAG: hypothetical protein BGO11_06355 [Solirubrobacterales bacterium 70-9]|mgnify:CR=1 FL=1|nr:MAG: hypothetical protein BGO11_06355 [Solirubrobacterales bacterium 70-9]
MDFGNSRIDSIGPLRPAPDAPGANTGKAGGGRVADASFSRDLAAAGEPAAPPQVRAEVQAAARAAARLHELGRELRFERDPEGALRVELRDVNGAVLRTVAPAEVFDFASGRLTA